VEAGPLDLSRPWAGGAAKRVVASGPEALCHLVVGRPAAGAGVEVSDLSPLPLPGAARLVPVHGLVCLAGAAAHRGRLGRATSARARGRLCHTGESSRARETRRTCAELSPGHRS